MDMKEQNKIVEMNVLDEVKKERQEIVQYMDEKIGSNIYYISLSFALRSLEGMGEDERKSKIQKNAWLASETMGVHDTFVLSFDNIVKKLANGKKSCDGFFYNFTLEDNRQHYLVELKNVDKRTLLKMLNDFGNEGIYEKVKNSIELIKQQLLFGGRTEKQEIIEHTHFFLVYGGKNNVSSKNPVKMVRKTQVSRDENQKQKRAARINENSSKQEDETYKLFGSKIIQLGLEACSEEAFPGDALPRTQKIKGLGRVRQFSVFSAYDFAKIIDAKYFDTWNWGEYLQVV